MFRAQDMTPILAGKDSIFDQPAWLALTAPKLFNPEYPDAERVEEYLSRFVVRLPRLVRLTRTAKQNPMDEIACADAATLATHLYLDTLEDWIRRVTTMGLVRTVPTTEPSCVPLTARSCEFASARVFKRIVLYWRLRCLVSGCILTLLQVKAAHMPSFAAAAAVLLDKLGEGATASVQSHEERAAECIAMSVQWAMTSPSPFPVYKLLVVSPLMNAFGVWMRSERRPTNVADSQRARNLQVWAVEQITAIARTIHAPEMGVAQLEAMNMVLMGGPLPGV
ncbi:hypothetical protein CLCR_08964 [Cladophialophora carrionii]|uniref:Transcription factor domain-containing protein n=1 Tax=Cladophialophora carrionii TaxID=86049 RepID=A0A1C1CSN4_9EURO|nr:hypothetical protein CLCR_08964 [Cladophialophora carrionii]